MYSSLIIIIYVAFISLGLPDALLGSAWPVMSVELDAPLSSAGIISMIISAGTIFSSLFSDRITMKLGTGMVTAISVFLTAGALFGFAVSNSFIMLCVFSVPFGLGAGAVDAALNNYVALHYRSKHMSWLHCFWGVGASISPYIMGYAIGANLGWRSGYGIVSIIQIVLTAILFISLPLWKRKSKEFEDGEIEPANIGIIGALKIKGVFPMLISFFAYCSFEATAFLWTSTYLVEHKSFGTETAATLASLFYLGMTFGRFFSGFFADKFGDKTMIRMGVAVISVGVFLMLLPTDSSVILLIGLLISGLGAAPIYPSIIHSTPINFGKENSHAIVGIQMASAYIGSTFMPPLFGLIAENVSIALYPFYLALCVVFLVILSERVNSVALNK